MNLLDVIWPARKETRLDDAAQLIASRSRDRVWQWVHRRAAVMGLAEARGYVRARSLSAVRAHVDSLIVAEPGLRADRCDLIRRAAEAISSGIVAEIVGLRREGLLLPYASASRRAA